MRCVTIWTFYGFTRRSFTFHIHRLRTRFIFSCTRNTFLRALTHRSLRTSIHMVSAHHAAALHHGSAALTHCIRPPHLADAGSLRSAPRDTHYLFCSACTHAPPLSPPPLTRLRLRGFSRATLAFPHRDTRAQVCSHIRRAHCTALVLPPLRFAQRFSPPRWDYLPHRSRAQQLVCLTMGRRTRAAPATGHSLTLTHKVSAPRISLPLHTELLHGLLPPLHAYGRATACAAARRRHAAAVARIRMLVRAAALLCAHTFFHLGLGHKLRSFAPGSLRHARRACAPGPFARLHCRQVLDHALYRSYSSTSRRIPFVLRLRPPHGRITRISFNTRLQFSYVRITHRHSLAACALADLVASRWTRHAVYLHRLTQYTPHSTPAAAPSCLFTSH